MFEGVQKASFYKSSVHSMVRQQGRTISSTNSIPFLIVLFFNVYYSNPENRVSEVRYSSCFRFQREGLELNLPILYSLLSPGATSLTVVVATVP